MTGPRARPSPSLPANTSSTDHSEEEAAAAALAALPAGRPGRARQPSSRRSAAGARPPRRTSASSCWTSAAPACPPPVDRNTLPLRGNDAEQADYLTHFRADSIVADAEAIRRALGSGPVDHLRPELRRFLRPQLSLLRPRGSAGSPRSPAASAPLRRPADRVYQATFQRVAARNAEYFDWYPEDRARSPGSPGTCGTRRNSCPTATGSPWSASRWWVPSWAATPGWTPCTTCWRMPSWAHPAATASRTPSWNRSAGSCPGPRTRCTR